MGTRRLMGALIAGMLLTGTAAAVPSQARPAPAITSSVAATDKITLLMSGDMLIHSTLTTQARRDATDGGYDYYPMLRRQQARVAAVDHAICHLETPIAPRGVRPSGYPLFKAPPRIVTAIDRVGYDTCTTASNHSLDAGFAGVRRTLDTLDARGIRHTGTARTRTERYKPLVVDVKGVKVGLVTAAYGTNGIRVPRDKPWSVNLISKTQLVSDVKRARAAGAKIVLVALHAGTEYQHQPNAQQRDLAGYLTRTGLVDMVYFHHSHVVQPIEKVNGRWVAWGLGNSFATSTTKYNASTGEQVMVKVTFVRRPSGWVAAPPRFIPGYSPNVAPYRWVDLASAAVDQRLSAKQRATYDARRKHVAKIVYSRGGAADGLRQEPALR